MKKFSFLGFFMVVALVVLGIGYAAWTDAVMINSTVSTGEMEVVFVDDCCAGGYIWDEAHETYYGSTGTGLDSAGDEILYAEMIVDPVDEKTVDVAVTNVYPGVSWKTGFTLYNDGTIPAVYDYVSFDYEGDDALAAVLLENVSIYTVGIGGEQTLYSSFDTNDPIYNLGDVVNTALAGLRIEPGEYVCIEVYQSFPITVGDTDPDELELTSIDYSLTVNFRQHNVLPTA